MKSDEGAWPTEGNEAMKCHGGISKKQAFRFSSNVEVFHGEQMSVKKGKIINIHNVLLEKNYDQL